MGSMLQGSFLDFLFVIFKHELFLAHAFRVSIYWMISVRCLISIRWIGYIHVCMGIKIM